MTRQRTAQKPKKRATDRKLPQKVLEFYLDTAVVDVYNDAVLVEQSAKRMMDFYESGTAAKASAQAIEALAVAEEALARAKEALGDELYEVLVVAIPRKEFFDLQAAHPPTEEQIEGYAKMLEDTGELEGMTDAQIARAKKSIMANTDTFPRALAEMCCPGLDAEELDCIFDPMGPWSPEDTQLIHLTCQQVCFQASSIRR